MERLTEKEIAQIYYLEDIVVHEVILMAISELESDLRLNEIQWTKTDILYKVVSYAVNNEMVDFFQLDRKEISRIVSCEYTNEINELVTKYR